MNYFFENLGDERFQEFCHSLINKEFPNSQAFPVGQPDGGRDSIAYSNSHSKKEFIVFQVKFVKNPNQHKKPHQWLKETISKEIKKIKKLIPKGAISYYLITNVKGTAHLDTGSIDKINHILKENIEVPAFCWWNDDLSRKIDSNPLLKWSFPEILNGQDLLNSVLFNHVNENKDRRENTIKSYLADQYELDNRVKFKQIDLQNYLFDLFTDVPISVKKINRNDNKLQRTIRYLMLNSMRETRGFNDQYFPEERYSLGAAEFLLSAEVQNSVRKVLLEGGPGQGKSTISQFICQVHRAKLLDKTNDLKKITKFIHSTPVRIPFKLDLRHVASWVEKKNPYKDSLSEEYFNINWDNSLESFLIGHIFYHSKNREFSSNDLIEILKISHVLFVFDGFDEIANLEVRSQVVDFINKGLNRLGQNCKSIQVIITSRPAAFSDTIEFSVDQYPHFELIDITPPIIEEYVKKWTTASNLNVRESNEMKSLVTEKVKLPHLRDLARSPMQLAIFISLLRTKGQALPNKRTALYDSYINLFFDRESEKNEIIRNNRELMIDIHQFLAWVLHSDSEQHKTSGIIQIEELRKILNQYLIKEEYNTGITEIFQAVEERVCALVSRVQGTFEFEVQPLREYFCAMYLYRTAPHSPPGLERSGTKPDRFSAISRNHYWQNVLRFFAGSFDKGELPMIIQELEGLSEDEKISLTNYPYYLSSQFLSDHVFTQSPKNQKEAIKIILSGIDSENLIYFGSSRSNDERISIPYECGGYEVSIKCFDKLKLLPYSDLAYEYIQLLNDNPYDKEKLWMDGLNAMKDREVTTWFEYGSDLHLLKTMSVDTINLFFFKDEFEVEKRIQLLFKNQRFDVINSNKKLKAIALNGILAYVNSNRYGNSRVNSLAKLSMIIDPFSLISIINEKEIAQDISFEEYMGSRIFYYDDRFINKKTPADRIEVKDEIDQKIFNFFERIKPILKRDFSHWQVDNKLWEKFVQELKFLDENSVALNLVVTTSAGLKYKEDLSSFNDLNDNQVSITKRARYARLKSGNINYWRKILVDKDCSDLNLIIFFTWATSRTICALVNETVAITEKMNADKYNQIVRALSQLQSLNQFNRIDKQFIEENINKGTFTGRLIYLIGLRLSSSYRNRFIYEMMPKSKDTTEIGSTAKLRWLMNCIFEDPNNESLLNEIKILYTKIRSSKYGFYHFNRNNKRISLKLKTSRMILSNKSSFPRELVSIAEQSYRVKIYRSLKPVGEIAEIDEWFD